MRRHWRIYSIALANLFAYFFGTFSRNILVVGEVLMIFKALKVFFWEMADRKKRFVYVNSFVTNIPGKFGQIIRSSIVPKYFKSAGNNIIVHRGIYYRSQDNLTVGNNVRLGAENFYQATGGITIGDDCLFGNNVKIWTTNHKFEDVERPISEQGYDIKGVTIGPNCWLGANAFVMPGTNLDEGCVVSAGAVVGAKDYPAYSIIAGNPARVIGNRKKEAEKRAAAAEKENDRSPR